MKSKDMMAYYSGLDKPHTIFIQKIFKCIFNNKLTLAYYNFYIINFLFKNSFVNI